MQENSVLAFSVQDTSWLLILIYVESSFSKMKVGQKRGLFCFQSSKRPLYLENDELPRKLPSPCWGGLFDKYIPCKQTQKQIFDKKQRDMYKMDNR